jgi:hypothetical protein
MVERIGDEVAEPRILQILSEAVAQVVEPEVGQPGRRAGNLAVIANLAAVEREDPPDLGHVDAGQGRPCFIGQGHEVLLVALADGADHSAYKVNVPSLKPQYRTETQPCGKSKARDHGRPVWPSSQEKATRLRPD